LNGSRDVSKVPKVLRKFWRGFTVNLAKAKEDAPKKATLLNKAIWSETEIAGHTVEAIPTAVFLLKASESESLESFN